VTPYDVTPNEYTGAPENVPPPVSAPGNSLREAGPVIWTIAPCTFTFQVHGTTDGIVVMQDEVDYRGSVLLELDTALISFPAEDADVSFEPPAAEGVNAVGGVFAEEEPAAESEHEPTAEPAAESEPTPRESLQALARLHDEMAQQELAQQETAGAETTEQEAAPRVEAASAEAVVPAQDPEPTVIEPVAEEPVVIEPVKEEPVIEAVAIAVTEPEAPAEKDPRSADLRDMGLRVFAPPKPVPIDGSAMVREGQAILPRLTALPLRPKVAFAPSQSAAQTKKPMPKNAPAAQAE